MWQRFSYKLVPNRILITLMVVFPISLWILPTTYFDQGQSMCLSVLLLGQTCYGCGMTRGCHHLIHADFAGAWDYNKLSFVVLPILAFVYGRELLQRLMIEPKTGPWFEAKTPWLVKVMRSNR